MSAGGLGVVADTAPLPPPPLQRLFTELVAFTLDVKQAHWNVAGPAFLSLDALTEDLLADARVRADQIAACTMALGVRTDARSSGCAVATEHVDADRRGDREVTELVGLIDSVAATVSRSLGQLQSADPVAHELTVEAVEALARYRWMLQAQLDSPSRAVPPTIRWANGVNRPKFDPAGCAPAILRR